MELDENLLSSIKQPPPSESVEALSAKPSQLDIPSVDTKIFDGAAVIHFLSTAGVSTFEDFAEKVFLPYINQQLEDTDRVDIVWDTYLSNSIKGSAREKRGKGVRRKVAGSNKIPGKWQEFLQDSDNKRELFTFLTAKS